jgi:hypothetical protein
MEDYMADILPFHAAPLSAYPLELVTIIEHFGDDWPLYVRAQPTSGDAPIQLAADLKLSPDETKQQVLHGGWFADVIGMNERFAALERADGRPRPRAASIIPPRREPEIPDGMRRRRRRQ